MHHLLLMLRRTVPVARSALVIAVGMSSAVLIAVALARFDYALVLPAMRSDLGWSYGRAGSLNTAVGLGYVVGALLTPVVASRTGVRRSVLLGAAAVVATLALDAVTTNLIVLLVVRFIAGMCGAWAFVGGAEMVSYAAVGSSPELLMGLYVGGGGLGVVASGVAVPAIVAAHGWRAGWWTLALGAFAAIGVLWGAARGMPPRRATPAAPLPRFSVVREAGLSATAVAYFLFGLGYIVAMTFAVALVEEEIPGPGATRLLWIAMGVGMFVAGFVWPWMFRRWRPGVALGLILVADAAAVALLGRSSAPLAIVLAAVVFGGCVNSVVGGVTVIARRVLPADELLAALAALTVAFALGQLIGPTLFGVLSDAAGLRTAILASAVVLLAGAAAARLQPGVSHRVDSDSAGGADRIALARPHEFVEPGPQASLEDVPAGEEREA